MEEQPQEQPQDEPSTGSDDRPKIFKNINGWIAGVTGAVIALGGLATAVKQFMPDKQAEAAEGAAAPAKGDQVQAAADVPAAPEETMPLSYEGEFKGEPARIEYGDDAWVLTDTDGTYTYDDELLSPDETRLLMFDTTNKSYLRWPIKGGMAEWSTDKENWSNYAKLYPVEPAAEETAE